jgi:hypothetical protein
MTAWIRPALSLRAWTSSRPLAVGLVRNIRTTSRTAPPSSRIRVHGRGDPPRPPGQPDLGRVVEDRGAGRRLAVEGAADERHDPLRHQLRVLEDVVAGDLLAHEAPERLAGPVGAGGPRRRRRRPGCSAGPGRSSCDSGSPRSATPPRPASARRCRRGAGPRSSPRRPGRGASPRPPRSTAGARGQWRRGPDHLAARRHQGTPR